MIIKYSKSCGFFVTAAQDIASLTLICEYVGEVRKSSDLIQNDSVMELVSGSLDVVPVKYANVGRFFNGVGENQLKMANLRTMRCQVNGECRLLIYSSRKIKKGEIMLFDYNLGCKVHGLEPKYDTSGFE